MNEPVSHCGNLTMLRSPAAWAAALIGVALLDVADADSVACSVPVAVEVQVTPAAVAAASRNARRNNNVASYVILPPFHIEAKKN